MHKKALSHLSALCLLSTLAPLSAAESVIVFDSYGPDDSYRFDIGYFVGSNEFVTSVEQAFAFSPLQSGRLSDIWITISLDQGPNAMALFLTEDANGLPGRVLESFFLEKK